MPEQHLAGSVVLPQPEAPTMVTNSWSAISRSHVLEHHLRAVFLPDVANRDGGHQRSGSAQRKRARAQQRAARDPSGHGEQRDPHHVRQDHVHRQIAAHEEDAVAEAFGRTAIASAAIRNSQARTQSTAAARRSAAASICGSTTRSDQLPGRGAQRLRLDDLLASGSSPHAQREVARDARRDADDDQRDLRGLARGRAR